MTIELTESCIVDNLLIAQEITTRLRLLGCSVSIDDYGTGYSTMKQLTEFPFQELKVDRQYIADCHINTENQAIIKSVVEMAHALGMTVIAEGVETKQELAFVKEAGIEVVQGYYYSKPYVWA
ncbi:EAL domain-containing protein [Psychrosphaera algicola]|uniref:EAL domain-containing protein n=1 Tax=Psychrosphaera algicola TaxID=3023714 RepID=A0ABT5FFF8_9GAMM|nr:EAL domain-containing protein [Psychrosphaera sp. G1-22]MDC2889342.1 EAL domain-containing protein [Psychrosphaera sp. G1-22]